MELMIVVAIVAILASIAYPSYQWAVLKGKRAQGRTAILELLQQQERYMTQNNKYALFSNSAEGASFKTYAGDSPTDTPYNLKAEKCTAGDTDAKECIKITATPTFTDPEVNELWATSSGTKNCTGDAKTESPAPPLKVCWP